ncbi:hypothetical protein B0O80DRAFT_92748 [Mortierella sp. GBAus27b]|nr:hypothetical protein BGX31_010867 [Mortierella sp. GBA43]KAI8362094.1 hypothetical protein B0O80DRAFT_92748 [Mortierella sp. GBAus27b]
MPQLLESTRNYLSSTKLGRRLSNESMEKKQPQQPSQPLQNQRSTSQIRLSSLFAFEGKNRSSVSTERAADTPQPDNKKKRRSSSSQKSTQSLPAGSLSDKSPASDKSSRRTGTSASYYDVGPGDYPSIDQYQTHVWRRNLLEESIMFSLKLGYAEKPRSAKRSATDRSRKSVAAGNSPYQLENSSAANITHSYITLELPEDRVAQVLSASAVPHLFQIKHQSTTASRVLHSTGPAPTPRVLSGKTTTTSRRVVHKETGLEARHMPQVVAAAV